MSEKMPKSEKMATLPDDISATTTIQVPDFMALEPPSHALSIHGITSIQSRTCDKTWYKKCLFRKGDRRLQGGSTSGKLVAVWHACTPTATTATPTYIGICPHVGGPRGSRNIRGPGNPRPSIREKVTERGATIQKSR